MIGIRDAIYLAAIAIIVCGLLWWHHAGVAEGEARIRGENARALVAAQARADAQAAIDRRLSEEAIHGLQADLEALRRTADPVPVVRLCNNPTRPGAVSGAGAVAGPADPAPRGGVPGVPAGTGSGPDIGPGLQRLTDAAEVVSAECRALSRWARESVGETVRDLP